MATRAFTLSPGRRWLFRLLAVMLGLTPLGVAEVVCRVAGWGEPLGVEDPFVGFDTVRPLFTRDATGMFYETAPNRRVHFRLDRFAVPKPAGEFRIFCLGGSTVQGNPYGIETAFSTWLELSLRASDPHRPYRVVNCGGISYASYRIAPILEELLAYQPDLFIIYTGHNEFLEERTYHHIKWKARWLGSVYAFAAHSRFFNTCHRWVQLRRDRAQKLPANDSNRTNESVPGASGEAERPRLPEEVDAWLDHYGGLDAYRRDPPWRAAVVEHYEFNLRRMVNQAAEANVPVILVNPVSNLKDCPPFKSEPGELSPTAAARFQQLWEAARNSEKMTDRLSWLEEAVTIDPQNAAAHYLLGQTYLATGQPDAAREAFLRAKEEDLCPLRMIEPLHERLERVARQTRTPLIDVRALFERLSPERLVGEPWLLDHVHPSISGHQQIAAALFEELQRQQLATPTADWEARRDLLFRQQLATLTTAYYARGQEHLQGLRRWAAGRSGNPPQKQPAAEAERSENVNP